MALKWDRMPEDFNYLRDAVDKCGPDVGIQEYDENIGRHVTFLERATPLQLDSIRSLIGEILQRNHLSAIESWCGNMRSGRPSEKALAWHVSRVLIVAAEMDERLRSRSDKPEIEDPGVLDRLPESLSYLIKPALRYGKYQSENSIADFLESANNHQFNELKMLADRVLENRDYSTVLQFLDEYSIEQHEESARLYFLFLVLDHAGFSFG